MKGLPAISLSSDTIYSQYSFSVGEHWYGTGGNEEFEQHQQFLDCAVRHKTEM